LYFDLGVLTGHATDKKVVGVLCVFVRRFAEASILNRTLRCTSVSVK
jgi:hypothetical protein